MLYDALSNSSINDFSPAWRQTLEELSVDDILGNNLKDQIEEIFQSNQITPSVAHDELEELYSRLEAFKTSLQQITTGFDSLKIGADELEPDACELGILVPREAVKNKLNSFGNEIIELDKLLGTFSELTTGTRPGFNIRSLSSSDFNVFLDSAPIVGAGITIAVERIISVYKQILEIRKLHKELKDQGVPAKNTKGIKSHVSSIMETEIDKLVEVLLKRYWKKDDPERRNELATDLKFALRRFAKRIDQGYNLEVRVNPPDEDEEDPTIRKRYSKNKEHFELILSASKSLSFIKLEGEPILSLPDRKKQ